MATPQELAARQIAARGARTRAKATRPVHIGHPARLSKRVVVGACLLAFLTAMAVTAPQLTQATKSGPVLQIDLLRRNAKPFSPDHILGTDYLGQDVFAQAVLGSRASLFVGIVAAAAAVSFGSIWGALSAFAGGVVDAVMMRIVDGLLAIPSIILLLAFNSLISQPGLMSTFPPWVLVALQVTSYSYGLLPLVTVIIVISATTWLEAARIARAKIRSVMAEEYIEAAEAVGMSTARLLFRHLLPNAASVLLVEATLLVSDAVLMESGLSFLGLGLGPSTPSWGSMLSQAQLSLLLGNWWAVLAPASLITLTVAAVNLLGEGWHDLLETRAPTA